MVERHSTIARFFDPDFPAGIRPIGVEPELDFPFFATEQPARREEATVLFHRDVFTSAFVPIGVGTWCHHEHLFLSGLDRLDSHELHRGTYLDDDATGVGYRKSLGQFWSDERRGDRHNQEDEHQLNQREASIGAPWDAGTPSVSCVSVCSQCNQPKVVRVSAWRALDFA